MWGLNGSKQYLLSAITRATHKLIIYCVDNIVQRLNVEDVVLKLEGAANENITLATLCDYEGDIKDFKFPPPYDSLSLQITRISEDEIHMIAKKFGITGFELCIRRG